MASLSHEELVELFRADAMLAVEVLSRSGAVTLPAFSRAEVMPGELRELLPTERRVDVVVLLSEEVPVYVLLVEVQTSVDARKRETWPYYLAALRADYRCPVVLVVFSPDGEVRQWASMAIDLGHPGLVLKPVVVGPGEVPRVEDIDEAKRAPYRAVLSALMHANEEGAERAVIAAYAGLSALEKEDERDMWRELVAIALQSNEVAKRALEAMMNVRDWREKSGWYKEGYAKGEQAAQAAAQAAVEAALKAAQEAEASKQAELKAAREEVEQAKQVAQEAERARQAAHLRTERAAVEDLCEVLGIELGDERRALLTSLDIEALRAFRQALKQQRAWPASPAPR